MSKNQIGKQPETTTGAAPVLTSGDTLPPSAERGTGSALRPQVPSIIGDGGEDMVEYTQSPVMGRVLGLARRIAPTTAPLMILGESGTGKTWLAERIHEWSGRKGRLVVVDAGQLAASVAESELFGHERGAFTGASSRRRGMFEQAQGGTIFLDEIGDLPPDLQPKLLRVLESGRVRRVGASAEVEVDVRVVAATCRDMGALIGRGLFRVDLWHRLATVSVTMPPLRQRREDMPMILGQVKGLPDGVREVLLSHPCDWSGNLRELLGVARVAAACGMTADEVRPMLPRAVERVVQGVAPSLRRDVVVEMVRRQGAVRTGEVAAALGILAQDASRMLGRMVELGMVVRRGRGVYAVNNRLQGGYKKGDNQ